MADSAQIDKVNHHHEAIADLMLAFPEMKKGEIAIRMGYTQAWLSAIINSDAFVAYFEVRRMQYNQELNQKTVIKLYNVAMKAMDKVDQALDATDLDPRYALDAKDKALTQLGFGPKGNHGAPTVVQQNNFYASKDSLTEARQRMREVHGQATILSSRTGAEGVDIEVSTELSEQTPPENRG